MKRQLAAILHADVVGYSRLTGSDEDGAVRELNSSIERFEKYIASHNGRKVNQAGDAILAEFHSMQDALRAAVEFQQEMKASSSGSVAGDPLRYRIGIHLGEVIHDRGDIFGEGVNIAARIQELSAPGGICISSAVFEQIHSKFDFVYDDLGYRTLKNITEPVHVYRVRAFDQNEAEHPADFLTNTPQDQPLFDLDGGVMRKSPRITGGCLCGKIRFEISEQPIGTGFCHCRICQKTLGGPINAWVAFPVDSVQFLDAMPKVYSSSRIAERGFCDQCGTSLTYRLLKPEPSGFMVITTVSLDSPETFAPSWHGGMESKLPGLDIHDDLPRMRSADSPSLKKAWASVGIDNPAEWKP